MLSYRRFALSVTCIVLLVLSVPAVGTVRTWDGGGSDTEWATPANWDSDGYSVSDDLTVLSGSPTSTVNVIADNGGIITLNGPAAVANFTWDTYIGYTAGVSRLNVLNGASLTDDYGRLGFYGGTSGIATVSGTGSTWTNSDDIYVGGGWSDTGGTGELIVADGGNVSCVYGWLGYSSGSSGTATVSGAGSKWACSYRLYVGRSGTGELTIADGGVVSNLLVSVAYDVGSSGTITVSGEGSRWNNGGNLAIGSHGIGVLNITNGGYVENESGFLGFNSDSSGMATVSGAGSTWNNYNGPLYVGHAYSGYSTGNLIITGGGTVLSKGGYLGTKVGGSGTVTVSGVGSKWTNTTRYSSPGVLYVGYSGTGVLEITGGGAVSNTDGYLGYNSGSSGTVTISGTGSTWANANAPYSEVSGSLYVGRYGQGTLNITNGGLVSVAGTLTIDDNEDGDGFINMATGGMLALYGDADDSLTDFLGLISGTDAIRYWDDSASDWADINGATPGQDYTLTYLTEGDLDGYTVLTVPEPASAVLLLSGGILVMFRRRRK